MEAVEDVLHGLLAATGAGDARRVHPAGAREPVRARWFEAGLPDRDEQFTTYVEIGEWLHRRRASLLAHRTQVDPEGHWMRLPDDALREIFPWDEFALVRSLVGPVPPDDVEDDLFAGLRIESRVERAG